MDNKQLSEIKGTLKALEECISGNAVPECPLGDKCRTVIDKVREVKVWLENDDTDDTILYATENKRDMILDVLEKLEIAQSTFKQSLAVVRQELSKINRSWGDGK